MKRSRFTILSAPLDVADPKDSSDWNQEPGANWIYPVGRQAPLYSCFLVSASLIILVEGAAL